MIESMDAQVVGIGVLFVVYIRVRILSMSIQSLNILRTLRRRRESYPTKNIWSAVEKGQYTGVELTASILLLLVTSSSTRVQIRCIGSGLD